jgi:hypothetical protein
MQDQLQALLEKLATAFQAAPIKRFAEAQVPSKAWNYSLVTTTLERGGPLIVGFNWGAAQGEAYPPQRVISKSDYSEQDRASLARLDGYCRQIFGPDFTSRVSQTNYCFFRSETQAQISDDDLKLCQPIFDELLSILAPSMVLCFSSSLRDYLIEKKRAVFDRRATIAYRSGNRNMTYEAMRGRYNDQCEIASLPHPNAKIPGDVRDRAWQACFPELSIAA